MGQSDRQEGRHWLLTANEAVDHFHVLRPLGKGGMGQVFLARDTKLGRKVALKVIRPRVSRRAAERFLLVERLRHEPMIPVVGPSGAGKSSFVRPG